MAEIIKSSNSVADNASSAIKAQGNSITQVGDTGNGLTNLTVMGNLQSVIDGVNQVNSSYKELLSKDASVISDVKETYNELDSTISECMG